MSFPHPCSLVLFQIWKDLWGNSSDKFLDLWHFNAKNEWKFAYIIWRYAPEGNFIDDAFKSIINGKGVKGNMDINRCEINIIEIN